MVFLRSTVLLFGSDYFRRRLIRQFVFETDDPRLVLNGVLQMLRLRDLLFVSWWMEPRLYDGGVAVSVLH